MVYPEHPWSAPRFTRRIKQALQDTLEGQAKQAAADGKPPKPMVIDISV